jgi:cobalt-zinc-cadmium efflux system outer membrane protein
MTQVIVRRASFVICAALLTGMAGAVHAQAPPPPNRAAQYLDPKEGLTIDALVAMAIERAPALAAARARIDAAAGDRQQAGLRPNPSASVERREQFGGIETQTLLGISWPLDLFRRDARVTAADHLVHQAESKVQDEVREWAAVVRERAAGVLASVRQLEIADSRARFAKTRFELLAARTEAGAARPLDRDLADVEWRRAQAEVLAWQSTVDQGMAGLKSAIGMPADVPLRLALPIEVVAATLPAVAVRQTPEALEARPDIRVLEFDVIHAQAEGARAASEARFDLGVYAAYMTRQLDLAADRSRMHEAMLGVTVSLPWRNRQQGAIAAAGALKRAAESSVAARRLDASAEIDAARIRESAAAAAVALYRGGLMELAGRNLSVVRESFDLGRGTLFDVIEEERRYLELESAFTAALREVIDARTALLRALGVAS